MKSALQYLFKSENAGEIVQFLRTRGRHAHVIAPGWVQHQVFDSDSTSAHQSKALWSEELPAPSTVASDKTNFIVVADDADGERALVLSLERRKGANVYGLFSHIVPALLCSTNGTSAGKPTAKLKRYAILCIPRSGSRYFAGVLSNRGVGAPREHIREPLAHIIGDGNLGFKNAVCALEKFGQWNGIFGTKLISTFVIRASRGRIPELKSNMSWMVERGYKLVHLDRPLNEAVISSYIAFLMRQWHFFGEMSDVARAKLDALKFEDGAAWNEYVRFRTEQIITDSIATSLRLPSFRYSEIESDIEGVVRRLCDEIDVNPDELTPGSAPIPSVTRTVSPTYGIFAERLDALLDRRASEIEAATASRFRTLTGLGSKDVEALLANNW